MKKLTKTRAILLFATGLLAACSDPINRENYDQIKTGMTQAEVIDLLGEPDEFESVELGELSGGTARWIGEKNAIRVTFTNEKAAFKRFGEAPKPEPK